MRFVLMPLIVISAVAVASEATLTCSCVGESSEPIETISSDISLAANGRARSLESMTGAITLQRDSRVDGDVETGSGELVLQPGAEVAGDLSNDTGTIRIDGARVRGLVSTTYGDIYVGANSQLDGGILVQKRNVIGLSFGDLKLGFPMGSSTPPRVVIGPHAKVAGTLRFKRKVELLVSESATIGTVVGAKPVMFGAEDSSPLQR